MGQRGKCLPKIQPSETCFSIYSVDRLITFYPSASSNSSNFVFHIHKTKSRSCSPSAGPAAAVDRDFQNTHNADKAARNSKEPDTKVLCYTPYY